MRETTVEELKKLTKGPQNIDIDCVCNESESKFLETIEVSNTAFTSGFKDTYFVRSYNISQLIGNCYKNFMINKKYLNSIVAIELAIGNQKIDTVCTLDFELLYKIFEITVSDDKYIPIPIDALSTLFSTKYHHACLTFYMDGSDILDDDSLLKYDAYNDSAYELNSSKEIIIKQIVVNNLELNHPVTHIIIKTDSKEKLNLEVDGILKLSIEGDSYKDYMIFKMNEINFSRIQKARFLNKDIKRMIAINLNILRYISDMAGLAFSN